MSSNYDSKSSGSRPVSTASSVQLEVLEDLIAQLKQELAAEVDQAADLRSELARRQARIAELELQLTGITRTFRERGGESNDSVVALRSATPSSTRFSGMQKTKAIVELLREENGPLHRGDILKRLIEGGMSDVTLERVSGTLGSLHKRGMVVSPLRGLWALVK